MHAMLHSTSEDGGVTRMRHMGDGLPIPSKTAVELSPGRTHVMLSGLKQPLRRGQKFDLTLKFEKSGEMQAVIKVLDPASAGLQEAR
jgi:copper(I)-binding protein